MMASIPSEYRFAHYRLRPDERVLLAHDQPVKLGGRALDALAVLVQHADRPVGKAELMDRVWPKLVVEENNLQVQIAALRKALGPAAIVTIPGRGYRFTLPVDAQPAAEPASAREPSSAQARRDNLPEVPGPLVGRDADLAALQALLDEHGLVSIVGTGGIGKTRLALAVAHARRGAYRDGVWLAELASLSDPALVLAEVARVLGLQPGEGRANADTITAMLAGREVLLVLDNCEHLLDAVATLVDELTRRTTGIRMLVTSQEPLKLGAEQLYRLDPLKLPGDPHAAHQQPTGAVALFVSRAQAADPRFTLDASNAGAVLEICRRLDGIPLALELAAARVPLLGVEGLRARLDERFNVLTGGSRLVLRRHQTLRAALDFSHGLLEPPEQAVLRRLGVFAGSFAVDSAQVVCADASLDAWEVLDCLGALVDKSLVVAEAGAQPRLRLLETTRAYALEKLGEAGETADTLERHAAAVAASARRMYDDYMALGMQAWLQRYTPDLDNLRAAIEWSLRHASVRAIELIGDSLKLWQDLALHPEVRRHCEAALALLTADTPARAAGRLWYAEAMLCANVWPARSRDAARRAVELLRGTDDEVVLALAFARLTGSPASTADERRQALRQLAQMERPDWRGQLRWVVPYARALESRYARRFAEAREHYTRGIQIMIEQGETVHALRSMVNLGEIVLMEGDVAEAVRIETDVRRQLAGSHDQMFYLFASMVLVNALLIAGDANAAREPFESALPLLLLYDMDYRYAPPAALYAALHGDLRATARMLGYAEAANAVHGERVLDPNEQTVRDLAAERLANTPDAQREAWMAEGRALSAGDAFGAVLRAGQGAT